MVSLNTSELTFHKNSTTRIEEEIMEGHIKDVSDMFQEVEEDEYNDENDKLIKEVQEQNDESLLY